MLPSLHSCGVQVLPQALTPRYFPLQNNGYCTVGIEVTYLPSIVALKMGFFPDCTVKK